jgi:hypothetical protein
MCIRRELITITEGYYEDLALARDTGWYSFVAKFWSKILVKLAPDKLDIQYSAQQAAVNACRECDCECEDENDPKSQLSTRDRKQRA